LIEFYAPWCGHCKALKPEYDTASGLLDGVVKIAKVDCTEEKATCEKFGIGGFPTLKIFRDGTPSEYKGQRNAVSIVDVMKKQVLPAVSTLKADQVEAFKTSSNVVVIGTFKKDAKEAETFSKVANKLRDDFLFGTTTGDSNTVTLYKSFDEGKVTFDGKFTVEALTKFVNDKSVPLMDSIGPQNYEKLVATGLPLAYFFHGTAEQKTEFGSMFETIAKKFLGKVIFVYIDASMYGGHADNLALKQEWPAFGIHNQKENQKFPFDQSAKLEAKAVEAFVQKFVDGKLKATKKSEAVPESNDEDVKVIVGTTFEQIAFDKSKDVLVEFYAPWCGHCKKLAPIYEELGKSQTSDKIVIAKVDATTNDTPIEVKGFPTLILFKAGTNEQITFDGARELQTLQNFLKEKAKNGAEVVVTEDEEETEEESAGPDHGEL
jgi:protein disulfide-isomerase A1